MDEKVVKFIHGLSFGGIKFSCFPRFRVKCQSGVKGISTYIKTSSDGRLWTLAKLEMMIDLWQDIHWEYHK
jgi:hypothetical protein